MLNLTAQTIKDNLKELKLLQGGTSK